MEHELKTQLNELQVKIEQISKDVVKLTVINEHQYTERQSYMVKTEKLETEFTSIKGAMSLLKWLISIFGATAVAFIIAFCTWVITTNTEQQEAILRLTHRVSILENDDAVSKF